MKIKTNSIIESIFICDICGRESTLKWITEDCEAAHFCQHETQEYLINLDDNILSITQICSTCGKVLKNKNVKLTQETLKSLSDILDTLS